MNNPEIVNVILFVVMGTIGGLAHVIVDAEKWEDIMKFSSFRDISVAAIVGFLYNYLHSDWGFPDGVMCFVSGYMGTDFLLGIIKKYQKSKET